MKFFSKAIYDKIPYEYELESFETYHQTFLSYI